MAERRPTRSNLPLGDKKIKDIGLDRKSRRRVSTKKVDLETKSEDATEFFNRMLATGAVRLPGMTEDEVFGSPMILLL